MSVTELHHDITSTTRDFVMSLIGAGYMWLNALTNDHLSGWQLAVRK